MFVLIGKSVGCYYLIGGIRTALAFQMLCDKDNPLVYALQALAGMHEIGMTWGLQIRDDHFSVFPFMGMEFVSCTDLPGHAIMNH